MFRTFSRRRSLIHGGVGQRAEPGEREKAIYCRRVVVERPPRAYWCARRTRRPPTADLLGNRLVSVTG